MTMQLLAGLACLLAAVLQLAVYRSPVIVDNSIRRMARRILMVAMGIGTIYAFHAAVYHIEPGPAYLALLLSAMGNVYFALADLLPYLEKEHPRWSSHLSNSQ